MNKRHTIIHVRIWKNSMRLAISKQKRSAKYRKSTKLGYIVVVDMKVIL